MAGGKLSNKSNNSSSNDKSSGNKREQQGVAFAGDLCISANTEHDLWFDVGGCPLRKKHIKQHTHTHTFQVLALLGLPASVNNLCEVCGCVKRV